MRSRTSKQQRHARDLPHLTARLFGVPLLMDERKIDAIYPVFEQKILSGTLPEKTGNDDDFRDPGELEIDTANGIARIPVIGSLVRRSSWLNAYSGLTAYSEVAEALDCALSDARVKAILLQVDSFGGEAGGCFELCDKIFAARSIKPIWAVADIDALSAGYAILSSAQRCFVAARGSCGSVGVVSVHLERSRQNEMLGLTYTVFRAGQRKADFNPYEKLTPAAAAKQLASMERTRQAFVDCITRNRPISAQAVLETEGQWYDAEDGLSLGLVDGVDTFENVYSALVSEVVPGAVSVAQVPDEPPAAPEVDPSDDPPSEETPPDDDERGKRVMDPRDSKTAATVPPAGVTADTVPAAVADSKVVSLADAKPSDAAAEIANMCILAGVPARAATYIAKGATVKQVQAELLEMRAAASDAGGTELSNHHTGTGNGGLTAGAAGPATGKNNGPPRPETMQAWDGAFAKVHASNPHFKSAERR